MLSIEYSVFTFQFKKVINLESNLIKTRVQFNCISASHTTFKWHYICWTLHVWELFQDKSTVLYKTPGYLMKFKTCCCLCLILNLKWLQAFIKFKKCRTNVLLCFTWAVMPLICCIFKDERTITKLHGFSLLKCTTSIDNLFADRICTHEQRLKCTMENATSHQFRIDKLYMLNPICSEQCLVNHEQF